MKPRNENEINWMRNLGGATITFAAGFWYLSFFSRGTATDICLSLIGISMLLFAAENFLNWRRSLSDAGSSRKPETVRWLIIILVSLTLLASLSYPAGKPHFRLREREEAMKAYYLNPSASTEAAWGEEFSRLEHHQKTVQIILLPSVLLFDAVVIYFFWNYGKRKTTMPGNPTERLWLIP